LSSLLRGLKEYVANPGSSYSSPGFFNSVPSRLPNVEITAVVTVTDDGGSSGRLRRELDVLPPGDIRNCMVALSEDEALLSKLFQYRFSTGRGLSGHSFGNLFLVALTHPDSCYRRLRPRRQHLLGSPGEPRPHLSLDSHERHARSSP
jgi:2-phospho-L-lactate transferase/gluconeogenesis factor (CofD/UPF0052 family)